jgi:hypothetical protein
MRTARMRFGRNEKPSDGLEPSTPLLTIERRGGKRGHGREAAGSKALQEGGIVRRLLTARARRWSRCCSLSVPLPAAVPGRQPAVPAR